MVDDGGQAGIECSVGGSGGQMSVSSGTVPCAGATSSCCAPSAGGALCAPAAGGHVRFANGFVATGADTFSSSPSPGGAGTVSAQAGVGFCIGTAGFGSVSAAASAGVSVLPQSGAVSFCMGSASRGSASDAESVTDCIPSSSTGGVTGTVRAHTGVVSWVGTAGAGASGGVDSFGLPGSESDSKSIVSLSLGCGGCIRCSGE
jgi:hypothetical protein